MYVQDGKEYIAKYEYITLLGNCVCVLSAIADSLFSCSSPRDSMYTQ